MSTTHPYRDPDDTITGPRWEAETARIQAQAREANARAELLEEICRGVQLARKMSPYEHSSSYAARLEALKALHAQVLATPAGSTGT